MFTLHDANALQAGFTEFHRDGLVIAGAACGTRQKMWVTFIIPDSLKQEAMSKQKPPDGFCLAGWTWAGL